MEPFNRTSPWLKVDLQTWDKLVSPKYLTAYSMGTVIFWQSQVNEFVYIVKSGRVMMRVVSEDGREKIMMFAEKGGIFGETSAFEGPPEPYSAVALVDCQLYKIPISVFLNHLKSDMEINQAVMTILSRKASLYFNQVLGLTFGDIRYRVANVMLYLVKMYGVSNPEGILIDIPFTHQDMADLIKSSRVSVSKIFHEFSTKGIIKKINGRYVICNLQLLENIEKII